MPIIISDHMDPDVDFYVPPGSDATQALQEALQLSLVYGVAHIIIRGRLYVYASSQVTLLLDQSLHYIFEGDGLGEIIYVNPNNLSNVPPLVAIGSISTVEMQYITNNNGVANKQEAAYSTWGWIIAFKNMRLINLTPQRWLIITGMPYHMHSIMFYFDSVQFFANIWLNQTGTVLLYNCYANNAELLFDTQSRELMAIGCRFENGSNLAISPRGWTVVGCVFVGTNITYLNPGIDGNNGSVVGCVFDGATIVTQGADNLKIVATQFQNVTFNGGSVQLTQGINYGIVGCSFVNYNVVISDLYRGHTIFIAFNNFDDGSNLVILIRDNYVVDSITILGNLFSSIPTHNSFIFIAGSPSPGQSLQLSGTVNMLYVAFNTFINSSHTSGAAYGYELANNYRIHAFAYINVAISIIYAYIAFNYFQQNYGLYNNSTGKPIGFFSLQQLTTNVKTVQNLFFYFNVNENNPMYIPSSQAYTAQFNIGIKQ
ncbi:hypothetical protein [Saccharolobus islandicus]|uniref:hypothetical protein n=1 Tax=Saccharolobus islandicus TaxID=43080 RepID=UPI00048E6678|nr:hypothetical protein [Sulfolobus islandicus]